MSVNPSLIEENDAPDLAAHDKILIDNGWEAIAATGKAGHTGWRDRPNTLKAIKAERAANPTAKNTGARTGRVSANDIDLVPAEHVAKMKALADKILGPTLLDRIGAKGLTDYRRNETPIGKIRISGKHSSLTQIKKGTADEKEPLDGKVELLGTGQQSIIYGDHPDTRKPWTWPNADLGGEPLQTPVSDLPEVTPALLRSYARQAKALMEELGYVGVTISGDMGEEKTQSSSAAEGERLSWSGLRTRLSYIHPAFNNTRPACYPPMSQKRKADPLPYDGDAWTGLALCVRDGVPLLDTEEHDRLGLVEEWSRGDLWFERTGERLDLTGRLPEQGIEARLQGKARKDGTTTVASIIAYAADAGCPLPPNDEPKPGVGKLYEEFLGKQAEDAPGIEDEGAEDEARLAEKFRVIRPDEFHLLKPPAYLAQKLIPEMSIGLIYGPWGSFKTFVLIEILGGIAGNVKVFGKYTINQSGPVILAAAEQPNAAAQIRFPAWCKKHGLLVPNVPFNLMRHVPLVQHPQEVIAFVKSVKREKINPLAIGIDTLTRAMGGLDLNAPQAAGLMTNAADYIKDELGCAVIMTGHMGKDKSKKSFGSIVVPANCDFIFEIDRPLPKGPAIIFRNEKLKEDDTNPDEFLRSEKYAGSIVLNSISEAEYKKLIAKGGPGEAQALVGEIDACLRAAGFIGTNVCSTKELLNLVLSERGELENDPRVDDRARERLRNKIRALQEQGDETILALGRKAPGKTAGRQWSAVAPTPEDDGTGYLGSLDDA